MRFLGALAIGLCACTGGSSRLDDATAVATSRDVRGVPRMLVARGQFADTPREHVAKQLFGEREALGPRSGQSEELAHAQELRVVRLQASRQFGLDLARDLERRGRASRVQQRLGDFAAKRTSRSGEARIRDELISAGMYDTSPRKVLGYQLLVAIAAALLVFWLVPAMGGGIIITVVLTAAAGVGGWFAPLYYINIKKRQRFTRIDRQMPDMIDLLVVTIEAGLGILASMRVASETMADPLGQELRLTLQEQNMGLTLVEALENLLVRVDTPGVRMFSRSIAQGETMGVSTGQIMRNLALELRKRQRAYAEERAQKAPVKILFPILFLIMPALFIVLLLPVMITVMDVLG